MDNDLLHGATTITVKEAWSMYNNCSKAKRLTIAINNAVRAIGEFNSIIDLGCMSGKYLALFKEQGCDVFGVDINYSPSELCIPQECFKQHDLTIPYYPIKKYDLCMTFETIGHIEPEYNDVILDTICRCSDNVLFCSEQPQQSGEGHINCQTREYWAEKFTKRGYVHDKIATDIWFGVLYKAGRGLLRTWRRNATFFRKENINEKT